MIVQVNTDNQIDGHDRLIRAVEAEVSSALARFSPQITRIEIHIGDVNAQKGGSGDKRCSVEARLAGRKPEAVNHSAGSEMEACREALKKLQRRLDTLQGKLGEPQREAARRRPS
jgi:hypothetical protein